MMTFWGLGLTISYLKSNKILVLIHLLLLVLQPQTVDSFLPTDGTLKQRPEDFEGDTKHYWDTIQTGYAHNDPRSLLSYWITSNAIGILHISIKEKVKDETRRRNNSTVQRLSSLLCKYRRLSASWILEPPKPPTRKSITGITEDKTNKMANRRFPLQSQSFSKETEIPSISFPRLSQYRRSATLCGTAW